MPKAHGKSRKRPLFTRPERGEHHLHSKHHVRRTHHLTHSVDHHFSSRRLRHIAPEGHIAFDRTYRVRRTYRFFFAIYRLTAMRYICLRRCDIFPVGNAIYLLRKCDMFACANVRGYDLPLARRDIRKIRGFISRGSVVFYLKLKLNFHQEKRPL